LIIKIIAVFCQETKEEDSAEASATPSPSASGKN